MATAFEAVRLYLKVCFQGLAISGVFLGGCSAAGFERSFFTTELRRFTQPVITSPGSCIWEQFSCDLAYSMQVF
uniref:Uncharacterized protein n=1 Tax=Physcomitrium patens TaxID=3218 RepID=A0A7I3Z3D3_PHYPA